MSPIVTALSTYVPPTMMMSAACRTDVSDPVSPSPTAPSGWDAWIASWRSDFDGSSTATTDADHVSNDRALPLLIPIERSGQLSDLAAHVADLILASRDPNAASVDIIVFCHSSVDEHVSTTTAARLASMAGGACFPFSVSQQHGVSTLTALRLAQDLMLAEFDVQTVLVVAAEKWAPPFSRWPLHGLSHGDAAAAVLIERACPVKRGFRLVDAKTCHCAMASPGSVDVLLRLIDAMLSEHVLATSDVTSIGCGLEPAHTELVSRHLGANLSTHARIDSGFEPRGEPRSEAPFQYAHLGAAEPIAQLARAIEARSLPPQGPVLMWAMGVCGYVGCALLDAQGSPTVLMDRRWS